jgi:hypothetical protein
MGDRVAYRVLVGNADGKRPLGRPKRSREDSIKMDLEEVEWGGVDWIIWFSIGTSAGANECGNGPSGSIKCWKYFG